MRASAAFILSLQLAVTYLWLAAVAFEIGRIAAGLRFTNSAVANFRVATLVIGR